MSATKTSSSAQGQAQAQAQAQTQDITLRQASAVLKNCLRLGISNIAYARALFSPSAFVVRQYAGINVMVLRALDEDTAHVRDADALAVQEWLARND